MSKQPPAEQPRDRLRSAEPGRRNPAPPELSREPVEADIKLEGRLADMRRSPTLRRS
jgi:hypothetical protein